MNLKSPKINIGNKYWFIILALSILFVLSGVVINYFYFSKVIFTGPITVEINGINRIESENIQIYGNSPTGKIHEFVLDSNGKSWSFDYPCFIKNLTIQVPDSLIDNISVIVISSNGVVAHILKNQCKLKPNAISVSDAHLEKPSFFQLLRCILKWDEPWYILVGIITILFFCLILKLTKRIIPKIKFRIKGRKVILLLIFIFTIFHLIFFMMSNKILITSGILLILFILGIIYCLIFLSSKIFHFPINLIGLKMLLVSVCFSLVVVELIMIFTGTLSTSWEKRNIFFNRSSYEIENNSWFRVWPSDHNLKTREFCFHRSINSEGLSDIEYQVVKKENEYRIMAIGDSFTEGDGADKDSTWLKFLEYSIREHPLKKETTFMNAGVCGSDVFFEYMLFKEKMIKYKPDLLILSINLTDISDVVVKGGMKRFVSDGLLIYNEEPWLAWIYNVSHISRLLFNYILGYNELFIKEGDGKVEEAENEIFNCILNFQSFCECKGVNLLVVFHPIKQEIIARKLSLNDMMSKIEVNTSIKTLNLLDYYIDIDGVNDKNADGFYWKYDGHHNAKGYELYAKGVEWKLNQMGILDSLIIKSDSVLN